MASFRPKPELGDRTDEEFRQERGFTLKPQLGGSVPELGGRTNEEFMQQAARDIEERLRDRFQNVEDKVLDSEDAILEINDSSEDEREHGDEREVSDEHWDELQMDHRDYEGLEDLTGGTNYPAGPGTGTGGEACAPSTLAVVGHYPAPYDLYNVTATTVRVRGSNAIGSNNKLIGLAGVWEEVDPGAGGEDFDADLTPGDDEFIYLKVVRGTSAGNTLEMGAWPGDAVDGSGQATIYIPLWYFKLTAGEICLILDFRHVPRIDMMGN